MSTRGKRYLRVRCRSDTTSTTVTSANGEGAKVHGPTFGQGEPEAVEQVVIAGALFLQAEQVVHLAERDQAAGAGHEAQHHRFGDVARQVAQLEQGNDDLNGPDHQRQQKNGLDGGCW